MLRPTGGAEGAVARSAWWADTDLDSEPGFRRAARPRGGPPRQVEFWEQLAVGGGAAAPAGGVATAPEEEPPATDVSAGEPASAPRPIASCRTDRPAYADRVATPGPRRMARYLELSGALQSGENPARYFELPRARFRPRFMIGVERRVSMDLIRDVRCAPRDSGGARHGSWMGKVAL